jgi:hypothetical protein
MGRPSLLTPEQWEEIKRRATAGESISALAREFNVSRPLVSAKVSTKAQELRTLASAKLEIDRKIEKLPVSDRAAVVTYMDMLKSVSNNLATAANYGTANAVRLHKIAHSRIKALNPVTAGAVELRDIAAFTQVANKAASIGQRIQAANKAAPMDPDPEDRPDYSHLSMAELEQLEQLEMKARGIVG